MLSRQPLSWRRPNCDCWFLARAFTLLFALIATVAVDAATKSRSSTKAQSTAQKNANATSISSADAAAKSSTTDWFYTVRPGDNLWSIARRFCRDKDCDAKILNHNGLQKPTDLHAGRVISIPVYLLLRVPVPAHVANVNGAAFLERRNLPRQPLHTGATLQIDDHLITDAGNVTIVFADNSTLVLGDHSEIALDMLGALGDTGMVDTQVRAVRGRVEPQVVKHPAPGSSFRVATPTGTAVVRGTEFRIRAEDESFAELKTGALDFGATHLNPGFGLVTRLNSPPPPPEALLPAAELSAGATLAISVPMHITWNAVAGAVGYRVLLFRAGTPPELISVTPTTSNTATISAAPGSEYRAQIRAISASGLEGLDATLLLRALAAAPLIETVSSRTSTLALHWPAIDHAQRYDIDIARDSAFSNLEQTHSGATNSINVTVAAGEHFWRVRADNTSYSAPASLRLLPAIPILTATPRTWRANTTQLRWSMPDVGNNDAQATKKNTDNDAVMYRVQVARDASFANVDQEWTTPLHIWTLTCEGAICYVRVRAERDTTLGGWSLITVLSNGWSPRN